jgi:uncharacterized membrane protein YagU involved in acid resistance
MSDFSDSASSLLVMATPGLSEPPTPRADILSSILVAGLIAGTLDISSAFVEYGVRGVRPPVILRAIASGLLGMSAFKGGFVAATIGLLAHYFIAVVASFVFFLGALRFASVRQRPIISGLLFGFIVYSAMNQVVLPLSAQPSQFRTPFLSALHISEHLLFIGLPLGLTARFYLSSAIFAREVPDNKTIKQS